LVFYYSTTPLHLAVQRQHHHLVDALINLGCDINAEDNGIDFFLLEILLFIIL